MGLVAIILILVGLIIVLELVKHHFTKSFIKYIIIGIVFLGIILIASAYVDLGSIIGKDSTFSNTGLVISEGVTEDLKKINFKDSEILDSVEETSKNLAQKAID
mgnify:CR=1 FL=1|jgi:hypothetical protein